MWFTCLRVCQCKRYGCTTLEPADVQLAIEKGVKEFLGLIVKQRAVV